MKYLLTVLIPTLDSRIDYLDRLLFNLDNQMVDGVKVLTLSDRGQLSTGEKRNLLLHACDTEYCVFIDDDDEVSINYLERHMEILKKYPDVDAIGFKGVIYFDGKSPQIFIHKNNADYKEIFYNGKKQYLRPIMHINCIRTSIALEIGFPDQTLYEDKDYSIRLKESGLIKKSVFIDDIMYYYYFRTTK